MVEIRVLKYFLMVAREENITEVIPVNVAAKILKRRNLAAHCKDILRRHLYRGGRFL